MRKDTTWGQLEDDFNAWYDMTGRKSFQGYTLEEIQSHDPEELVQGE